MTEQQGPAAGLSGAEAGDGAQAPAGMPPRATEAHGAGQGSPTSAAGMDGAPAWAVTLLAAQVETARKMGDVASLLTLSIHATQQLLSALIASEEPDPAPAAAAASAASDPVDWEGKSLDPAGQYQHVHGKGLVRVD